MFCVDVADQPRWAGGQFSFDNIDPLPCRSFAGTNFSPALKLISGLWFRIHVAVIDLKLVQALEVGFQAGQEFFVIACL